LNRNSLSLLPLIVSRAIAVRLTSERWAVFGASGALTVAVLWEALQWVLRETNPRVPEVLP
jgi:hypothetical protein